MSDPALAAIASLQSSVTRLQAGLASLQVEVFGKAGVTALTSTITSEAVARESSDAVVAARIGILGCDTRDDRAAASAASSLTSRVTSAEDPELHVKPDEAVEPLRMGKVVFYGESARAIRAAQEVLRAAGAGQLEVVKRSNEPGESYVVIDGQVFLSQAEVDNGRYAIDPARFKFRSGKDEQGRYYAAGFGLGVDDGKFGKALEAGRVLEYISSMIAVSSLGPDLQEQVRAIDEQAQEQVRQVIRNELKPGGMLHRG